MICLSLALMVLEISNTVNNDNGINISIFGNGKPDFIGALFKCYKSFYLCHISGIVKFSSIKFLWENIKGSWISATFTAG